MDPQAQASFIPKKPLVTVPASRSGDGSGIFWFIALFIFIASVVAALGAFAYQQYLQNKITSASNSLALAQAAYDPSTISDLIRLNSRLEQAGMLLQKHVAPSTLFTFLEENTLASVQLNSFEYDLNPDGSVTLKVSGEAADFASVALQSDQFGSSTPKILQNVVFSGVNTDPSTGRVQFQVTANVDPSYILYSNSLGALSTDSSAVQTTAAIVPSTITTTSTSTVPTPPPPTP